MLPNDKIIMITKLETPTKIVILGYIIFAMFTGLLVIKNMYENFSSADLLQTNDEKISYLLNSNFIGTWKLTSFSRLYLRYSTGTIKVKFFSSEVFDAVSDQMRPTSNLFLEATLYDAKYSDVDHVRLNIPIVLDSRMSYNFVTNSIDKSITSSIESVYGKTSTSILKEFIFNGSAVFNAMNWNYLPVKVSDLKLESNLISLDINTSRSFPSFSCSLHLDDGNAYLEALKTGFVIITLLMLNFIGMYGMYQYMCNNIEMISQISFSTFFLFCIWDSFFNIWYNRVDYLFPTYIYVLRLMIDGFAGIVWVYYFSFRVWETINKNELANAGHFALCLRFFCFYFKYIFSLIFVSILISFVRNSQWLILLSSLGLVPQIFKNAQSERPYKFDINFLILCGLSKFLLPFCMKLKEDNIGSQKPYFGSLCGAAFIWGTSLGVLYLQDRLDNKFFFPTGYFKQTPEEVAPISEPQMQVPKPVFELNNTMNSENLILNISVPERENNCKICLGSLEQIPEISVIVSEESMMNQKVSRKNARRKRTVEVVTTVCNHTFHSDCLKKWTEAKSECPECNIQIKGSQ
jgi:hypothetical protein